MVNKYNLTWQIVRVECKAKEGVANKLAHAVAYVDAVRSREAYGRVLNWMDGLAMGYKNRDQDACEAIWKARFALEGRQAGFQAEDTERDIGAVDGVTLKALYLDLHARSMRWLAVGQIHQGQEAFIDRLWEALIDKSYRFELMNKHTRLGLARCQALVIKARGENKSTFFF